MNRSNLNKKVFPKLSEALPTIENTFFRSPLTDKKRKEAIFSCPKSSTMKYLPPAVNDIASTTTKKADSVIIFEPKTEPIFEPKAFYELVTAKNTTRRTDLRRTFQRRQQSIHQSYSGGGFAQAQQTQDTASIAPLKTPAPNNHPASSKQQSFCGRASLPVLPTINNASASVKEETIPEANKVLTEEPTVCYIKEKRRTQTSPQLEEAKPTSREKKFQHRNIANNMFRAKNSEAHLEWESISALSATILSVARPKYLHQNFAPSIGMGKVEEKTKRAGISNKLEEVSNYPSTNNHTFRNSNKFKEYNSQSSNIQNQGVTTISIKTHKNRKNIFTWICKLYKKITSNFNIFSFRPLNSETHFRAQEQITSNIGYMDINNTELKVLQNPTKNMGRSVISTGVLQILNIYIFQQHSMRNSCWLSFLFWIMSFFKDLNEYQSQGVIDYIIRTPAPEYSRKYLEMLLIEKYSTTSNVQSLIINPADYPSRPQDSRINRFNTQQKIMGKSIFLPTMKPDNTSNQKGTP
ncbi:hypothetical protein BB561_001220 [Smittium simulii]|uniref:Uncharacterized protein n=1 Tax=Smittium simulii TaxID=133385 RepID=A0A2T9YVR2_9FUNG|nr:hypothetical protein BB561_001220 [Smittium simulii]